MRQPQECGLLNLAVISQNALLVFWSVNRGRTLVEGYYCYDYYYDFIGLLFIMHVMYIPVKSFWIVCLEGIFCTATSDRCLSAPCHNGSSCVDTVDDYACICATEGVRYMGKNCDQLYDACSFAPCENCSSVPGTARYSCVCPDGFTGDNCTEEVNECESDPCHAPRSLCVDRPNGYFCRCPEGYGGRQCRTRVTDCVDRPCENNGTCQLQPEGFQCHCAPGFNGETCTENVDECASEPCQNGAICVDAVAEFHCFCVPGFQGYNCEIDINECASRPCENNATCINEKDHYQCECLLGFAGTLHAHTDTHAQLFCGQHNCACRIFIIPKKY